MDTNALKKFAQDARQTLKKTISIKLKFVLSNESLARRENQKAITDLENRIRRHSEEQVIEEVAYTWFNRLCALQYMDVNGYNSIRVISPSDNQTRPEILSDANAGVFDNKIISENTQHRVTALLDGRSASNDPDNEAYRLLLVSVCNYLHTSMPFMFERISDYTELLLPDDMLSRTSIINDLKEALTLDNCEDVEVIGWLYQFYISEKKDEVFAGLKKNQKVTPENIPAATQLFTPHWIVKYLIENSLGRLWMLNRPNSSLVNQMEYYIRPEEPESDFLQITSPEEIKVCDPACGSGHMLTYAFDLLYFIYQEEGYDEASIPSLIIQNNLYGIELDKRAGDLAAFALTMKARSKQRSFLRNPIQPNICVLENVSFDTDELNEYINAVGRDLFTAPLRTTLRQFEEADNFGSLIQPALEDVESVLQVLQTKDFAGNLFLKSTHDRVLKVLHQAEYLRQKYHVVVANPPYMGAKGMNGRMTIYLKDNYTDVKSDLFSAFMVRNTKLALHQGQLGFMTPFVWMFISSYEKLRIFLIEQKTITSLIQLEYSGFDGATVPICTFTLQNNHEPTFKGGYIKLSDFKGAANQAPKTLQAIANPDCGWFYRASSYGFQSIPGNPIVFWISKKIINLFNNNSLIGSRAKKGLSTGDNDRFIRFWFEVNINEVSVFSGKTWFPTQKGGEYRKWYGNFDSIIYWKNNGNDLKNFKFPDGKLKSVIRNESFFYKSGVTWSAISSGKISMRSVPNGFIFNAAGPTIYSENDQLILSTMNSKLINIVSSAISTTLNFEVGQIQKYPILKTTERNINIASSCIKFSKSDWDSYETSWDFTSIPFLSIDYRSSKLESTYKSLRTQWQEMTDEMLKLEEENNSIFIDSYGLQDELTPDVPIHEITLTCNPAYRYGQKVSKEDQETRLCADTMKEFISYSVGCMFGRYALEEPGLVLANAGDTIETYINKIPNPKFPADDDNVIPILDADWFEDDIVGRFRKFLRITFGDESFEENLNFIETAIGRSIRDYFVKDFYKDHIQTYKKRPIYWQFSSPKGSFNALIYMHRYNRDTVSTLLNSYLRDYQSKLTAEKTAQERIEVSATSNAVEKTKALKEIQSITSILNELEEWERNVIFPLASQRIEIDLDDGVKVNYPKFGTALTKVVGLS